MSSTQFAPVEPTPIFAQLAASSPGHLLQEEQRNIYTSAC